MIFDIIVPAMVAKILLSGTSCWPEHDYLEISDADCRHGYFLAHKIKAGYKELGHS